MNDRLRFRAWDKRLKKFTHEVTDCGKWNNKAFNPYRYEEVYPFCELDYLNGIELLFDRYSKCIIIEQCTGLKDKNGKLIYEGDIVHYIKNTHTGIGGDRYAKVFWYTDAQCFAIETSMGDYYNLNDFELEIVGNIHENKELLEN